MKGPIAWMVRNGVAANLLMVFLFLVGFISVTQLPQESFPSISLGLIQVRVDYPGGTPAEIEEAIIQRVEERIEGIEGIDRVLGTAAENSGVVVIELETSADEQKVLDDIKGAVDQITSFPAEAEEPSVQIVEPFRRVQELVIYGDVPENTLKEAALRIQDDLTALDVISRVDIIGARRYEVAIEVPKDVLRSYDLTLQEVSQAVRRGSLDLPGGSVETDQEEIRVAVRGESATRDGFADIVVRAGANGSILRLGDIATVRDGFEEQDLTSLWNGQPSVTVRVMRSEEDQLLDMAEAIENYVAQDLPSALPRGLNVDLGWDDVAMLESRVNMLLENGLWGFVLVVVALAIFLNLRLAIWTAVGISVCFVGTFAVMSVLDISITMMSLFAFVLALGIVVDDAIVVGEHIYQRREDGLSSVDAAITGARRVAKPVVFAVLTTVAAFTPLMFVPGIMGNVIKSIPIIVIAVLLFSLVEALFIFPYHLSHLPTVGPGKPKSKGWFARFQDAVQRLVQWFVDGWLDRWIRFAIRRWGLTLSGVIAVVLIIFGLMAGGHVPVVLFQELEGNYVFAYLEMPEGTTSTRSREIASRLEEKAWAVGRALQEELPEDDPPLLQNIQTTVGFKQSDALGPASVQAGVQPNIVEVAAQLLGPEERTLPVDVFINAWRDSIGVIPGARLLTVEGSGIDFGAPVLVELTHPDDEALQVAVSDVKAFLAGVSGIVDVFDDRGTPKRELQLELKPQATTLGITLDDLARQVRAAFFGVEGARFQRGQEEVRVYARLPEDERSSVTDLRDYRIRAPGGGAIPLSEVADISYIEAPATIRRIDGRRAVSVSANLVPGTLSSPEANVLAGDYLDELVRDRPGLGYALGGQQGETLESLTWLAFGFLVALVAIYALLAIPFRSYTIPLVIMGAIPLGPDWIGRRSLHHGCSHWDDVDVRAGWTCGGDGERCARDDGLRHDPLPAWDADG